MDLLSHSETHIVELHRRSLSPFTSQDDSLSSLSTRETRARGTPGTPASRTNTSPYRTSRPADHDRADYHKQGRRDGVAPVSVPTSIHLPWHRCLPVRQNNDERRRSGGSRGWRASSRLRTRGRRQAISASRTSSATHPEAAGMIYIPYGRRLLWAEMQRQRRSGSPMCTVRRFEEARIRCARAELRSHGEDQQLPAQDQCPRHRHAPLWMST